MTEQIKNYTIFWDEKTYFLNKNKNEILVDVLIAFLCKRSINLATIV